MKRSAIVLATLLLSGCPTMGYQEMSAEQIRASHGLIGCSQLSSLYGKGSTITYSPDDTRKGATAKGKTVIKCGEAEMTIESDVGVAPSSPAKP